MESTQRHVFRFFVDELGAAGAIVELAEHDARHARVLHGARTDAPVEVVDGAGRAWRASFDGPSGRVHLHELLDVVREPAIVLHAFVTVGGRTDELVDAAVQAGATRIVPVVRVARDRAKVDARQERLHRIATSAAKQAKRGLVPMVVRAIEAGELLASAPGIVVDPTATELLDEQVRASATDVPVRLLVGASDGFPDDLVDQLVAAGWRRGRLGATILRAELAAGVAVAIAAMHAPQSSH